MFLCVFTGAGDQLLGQSVRHDEVRGQGGAHLHSPLCLRREGFSSEHPARGHAPVRRGADRHHEERTLSSAD